MPCATHRHSHVGSCPGCRATASRRNAPSHGTAQFGMDLTTHQAIATSAADTSCSQPAPACDPAPPACDAGGFS